MVVGGCYSGLSGHKSKKSQAPTGAEGPAVSFPLLRFLRKYRVKWSARDKTAHAPKPGGFEQDTELTQATFFTLRTHQHVQRLQLRRDGSGLFFIHKLL